MLIFFSYNVFTILNVLYLLNKTICIEQNFDQRFLSYDILLMFLLRTFLFCRLYISKYLFNTKLHLFWCIDYWYLIGCHGYLFQRNMVHLKKNNNNKFLWKFVKNLSQIWSLLINRPTCWIFLHCDMLSLRSAEENGDCLPFRIHIMVWFL